MKRNIRRAIFTSVMVLVVVSILGVYTYASSKGYDTLSLPKQRFAHATPSVQFEDVTFPARGRTYKVYAYYLPGEAGYPALINVHGRFSSRHDKDTLDRAQAWRGLGYSVLSLDLSDNGGDTVEDGRLSMGLKEQDDETVAYHHGVDLYDSYKAAGVNVTFWGLPPIPHGKIFVERREEYLQRLDEFFRSTLTFKTN